MANCCGCMATFTAGIMNGKPWRNPELDRILELVRQAGGNINAEVLTTIQWNSGSDLDMHLYVPSQLDEHGNPLPSTTGAGHIYYSSYNVNKGHPKWHTGYLDIDMNAGSAQNSINPVENIGFDDVTQMPDGMYMLSVNQFANRSHDNNRFTMVLAFKEQGSTDFTKVIVMRSKFSLDQTNASNDRNSAGMYDLMKFKVSRNAEGTGKDVKVTWLNAGGFDVLYESGVAYAEGVRPQ